METMKSPQTIDSSWLLGDLPELYRKALEQSINRSSSKWFHLPLANWREINCEACSFSSSDVSAQGMPNQVQADPLHLPFADNPVMFVWHIHCRGAIRIVYCMEWWYWLMMAGWWLVADPISLMGLPGCAGGRKISPITAGCSLWCGSGRRCWILKCYTRQLFPRSSVRNKHGKLLNAYSLGCLTYCCRNGYSAT